MNMRIRLVSVTGTARIALCAALYFSAIHAQAASLITNTPTWLGNGSFDVSVYPGSAAYTSGVTAASGDFGDRTILDYRILHASGGNVVSNGYASGPGDRVLVPTNAATFSGTNRDDADLWTVSDPGVGFVNAADYTTDTLFVGSRVRGEIDISGMTTGRLYMIAGYNFSGTQDLILSLTMSGGGQTDVSVIQTNNSATGSWVWEIIFGDASQYDTISYDYGGPSGNSPTWSRGRYMGMILDGQVDSVFWWKKSTTAITRYTARATATINDSLQDAVLVWDTSDQGTGSTNDWANSISLGAPGAGAVVGQITGLSELTSYTWRMYGSNATATAWTLPETFETIGTFYNSEVLLIDENANHEISVYAGKARYDGNRNSGNFGDGTVIDYRFFNNANPNNGYATGPGGLISSITYSGQNGFSLDYPQVWTVSDPDSQSADFTTATISGNNDVDGTVDISGMASGTVYVLCGSYDNSFTVSATMSGTGQTDINASGTLDPSTTRNTYTATFPFINDGGVYETISYNYLGGSSGRSRFMGVVVDGTPNAKNGTIFIIR